MSFYEWSTTAASNATADANINWAEGQAPSTVNNSARSEMAAMASALGEGLGGAKTTGGTGSAYTLTLSDVPTAYTTSMLFMVKFHAVSASTTATINVNSLGAKTLKLWDGSALPVSTYIPVNSYGLIKYDGTNMRVFLPAQAPSRYEEGSFTPVFTFDTPGDLSVSYAKQVGRYVRVGATVHYWLKMEWTPTYTTSTGSGQVTGFPFTSAAITDLRMAASISDVNNIVYQSGDNEIATRMDASAAILRIMRLRTGTTTTTSDQSTFPSGTAFTIAISGSYRV